MTMDAYMPASPLLGAVIPQDNLIIDFSHCPHTHMAWRMHTKAARVLHSDVV
jgi:hypothetical protein